MEGKLLILSTAALLLIVVASVTPRGGQRAGDFPVDVGAPDLIVLFKAKSLNLLNPVWCIGVPGNVPTILGDQLHDRVACSSTAGFRACANRMTTGASSVSWSTTSRTSS